MDSTLGSEFGKSIQSGRDIFCLLAFLTLRFRLVEGYALGHGLAGQLLQPFRVFWREARRLGSTPGVNSVLLIGLGDDLGLFEIIHLIEHWAFQVINEVGVCGRGLLPWILDYALIHHPYIGEIPEPHFLPGL